MRPRQSTSPNPRVGALLVKDGQIVGQGWHRGPGTPHAEVVAIDAAGDVALGSTLYVTLEPCSHHGRTPPCIDKIISSRIGRVVAGVSDPDPKVNGAGIEALRNAGVEVDLLESTDLTKGLYRAYITQRRLGRPFVTYKTAVSLDGRTSAADGTSQWISGEESRLDAHRLRAASDAIAVGIGTVLEDDPSLTVRGLTRPAKPKRIVFDSSARTPTTSKILSEGSPTIIVTSTDAPEGRVEELTAKGSTVIRVPPAGTHIDLARSLRMLADEGVVSMLLEGGPVLAGAFQALGAIDLYVFYVSACLLGDGDAPPMKGWRAESIQEKVRLRTLGVRRLGEDIRIDAEPKRGDS